MTLADLITKVRTLANDTPTSNSIRQETPGGLTDGSNKNFRLQNWPVVTGSMYLTNGSTFRTQAGFTLDLVTGIFVMGTAPAAAVAPWEVDYNFLWFTDTDHTDFLNNGAMSLGYTDPTQVMTGLIPALAHFALHDFWKRRSSQYAHRYSSTGGIAGHSVEVVTEAFKKLADEAWETANRLRDDFYKKQGRREDPASGIGSYSIDPFTPRR